MPRGPQRWSTVLLAVLLVVAGCGDGSPTATDEAATETDREDVTIAADGLELVGTLRLPSGDPPFPAVAIVHGSGPQSRHGTVQGQLGLTLPEPVAVYDQLADGLQAHGYAVLTWDKRTCGPFNRCGDNRYPTPPDDLTFDTFVDDADAVLDALAARDDLDELVLIGHSKGGTVATELLDRRGDLAAVVLLAASAWPIDEVIAVQAERLAELVVAAGQQGVAADQAVAEVRQLAEDVAAIADGEVDGPDVAGASRAFWASWIDASRRGPERAHAAAVPILALGGEHDWNVPPEQVRAWGPGLPERSEVRILPELTHALTRLGTDDPAAITPADVGSDVEPAAIDAIAGWLDATLAG
jgi:uncharacterized protein